MALTKRKLIYPVVILLAFVCLVVIGVLYVQLKDLDTLRDLVAQEIKAETRRDVRIGAAHLDFSEGIGLQLHDVTLKSSSKQESDFTCKEVLVLLRALPLLNGEIEIQKIIFEGLILQVTRDDRGDFNFGNLSSIESHRSGATLTDFIRAGLMHSVQVRQGELWLVDHHISTGAEPLVTKIKNMSLSLTKPLMKTSLRVHLTGEMPYAPDKSGTLKLDGKLRVPREEFNLSQVALEGNLEVRDQGTQPFALYLDKVFAQNPGVHKVSLDTRFAGTLDGHIQLSGVLKHEQPASLQPGSDRRSRPVKGSLDFNMIFNRDTVEFKQLDYRSGNFLLQIQGTYARFMSEKARLTASLKTTPFQVQDGETYLPLKVFSRDLHRRVRRLVKKGEIEITALNIEGPRAIFEGRSNAEIEKYDSGSIILRHADFGVDALPLSDVTGEIKFGKGVAEVTIQQARFDRVSIKNFIGTIVNPITHPRIEVTLEAEAALAPLANTIEKNWTLPRQLDFLKDLKRIQGMVRGRLAVQGPLEHWEQLVWSGNVSLERAGFMKMAWPAPIHNINGSIHFQSAVPKSNAQIKKKAPRTWTLRFEKFNGEYGNHYFRDINGASFVKDGVPVKQVRGTLLLGALKAEEVISMAETVAQFLKNEANRDRKLIVLAGGFHVQYGYGIPKRAFRRVPHAYSIILPVVTEIPKELKDREMKMKKVSIPLYSADFGWKVSYIVPPPNRIRLGVFLEELENGLKVLKVEEGSNAERMNLRIDDVLLNLGDHELADVEDLAAQLQKRTFGDTVRLRIKRGDSEQDVSGVLQEAPKTE